MKLKVPLKLLVVALAVAAMQNGLFAEDQSAGANNNTSVIAEGISSNPGAVDSRAGTGELAETVEKFLRLPQDTGVYLGGVWAGD
ncbi:MAG TPA: hypothetical protein VIG87_00215, partial [Candidatus Udaeobacter sp.]